MDPIISSDLGCRATLTYILTCHDPHHDSGRGYVLDIVGECGGRVHCGQGKGGAGARQGAGGDEGP